MTASRSRFVTIFLLLCALAMIYGCDDEKPVPIATSTAINPDAIQILEKAVEVTEHLQSYHFVSMGGDGDFVAPDRYHLNSEYNGTRYEEIQVAGREYIKQSSTDLDTDGPWIRYDTAISGALPDSSLGIFLTEMAAITAATIIGDEVFDGHEVTRINFRYNPSVFGIAAPGVHQFEDPSGADVWIAKDTNRILKLIPSVFESEVYFEFSRFNEPVTPPIQAPAPDKVVTATPYIPRPSAWPTVALPLPKP